MGQCREEPWLSGNLQKTLPLSRLLLIDGNPILQMLSLYSFQQTGGMQQLTPLEKSTPPYFAGIDVGGTNTKIGIVDDLGQTLAYESVPTIEEEGPGGLIARAGQTIRRMLSEKGIDASDLKAAGLGTPGPMDIPKGLILDPTNLPHWRHFPVRDRLSDELELPVAFSNDANAAAYGEYWVGGG